jgi:hypothetical protein
MNRKAFSLFLGLVVAGFTIAQNYLVQVRPQGSDFWGYANEKGEIVIEPQYRQCFAFGEDGYAAIYDSGKKEHYFINAKNERLQTEVSGFVLMNIFGFGLKGFSDGMVGIQLNKKWGYLNREGKLVIAVQYDKINAFDNGIATAERGGKFYILDKSGNETEVTAPGIVGIKPATEGLIPFNTKDKKFGFLDKTGKVVVEPKFKTVGYFAAGLAWAKLDDGKIGFINTKGEWAIQPNYDMAKDFSAGDKLARVKKGEQILFVNASGAEIVPVAAKSYGDFSNGLAYAKLEDGKVGFINTKGEWAIQPSFDGVGDFSYGFAVAKSNGAWGIIDTKGKWVCEPKFQGIKDVAKVK